jgi:hypothetical protein
LIINRLEGKEERTEKLKKIHAAKEQEYSSMFAPNFNFPLIPPQMRARKAPNIYPQIANNSNILAPTIQRRSKPYHIILLSQSSSAY